MLKSERNDIFTCANDPLICCNEAGFFIIERSNWIYNKMIKMWFFPFLHKDLSFTKVTASEKRRFRWHGNMLGQPVYGSKY